MSKYVTGLAAFFRFVSQFGMHLRFPVVFLGCLLLAPAVAAQYAFNISYGSGRGIAADGAGGVYATGNFAISGDFDPGPGEVILTTDGSEDCFVAHYDALGRYVWAFSIPAPVALCRGHGVSVVLPDELAVGGWFSSGADFDPDPTSEAILNAPCNESAAFVARYTGAGDYVWAFPLGGCVIDSFVPGANETWEVAATPDGGVLVTGILRGAADLDPGPGEIPFLKEHGFAIFLASYDADGAFRWGFQIGDDSVDLDTGEGLSVATEASGGGVAVGTLRWSADFDPEQGAEAILTPISGGGRSDAFVASYDHTGAYRWAFNLGSPGVNARAWDVVIDDTGNAYVTGEFRGPTDFDPDPASSFVLNPANPPFASGFIASYSAGGGFRWAERLDGHGRALTMDALGNVVFAGTRPSFLGSYSPGGVQRWVMPLDTASSKGRATALGVATLPQSRLAVAGEFIGTVDFDPGPEQHLLTSDSSPPLGFTDIFVASYTDGGGFPVTNEPESGLPTTFALEPAYPNPFNPTTTIPFALPEAFHVRLMVYDVLGRQIAILADSRYEAGRHEVILDGSRMASGLYLVRALMEPESEEAVRTFTQRLTLLK